LELELGLLQLVQASLVQASLVLMKHRSPALALQDLMELMEQIRQQR
jgi:hypothetical protein